MIYRGVVITGADTGAGKTAVACGLARLFRESGQRVGVLKPVETGCSGPDLVPADALELARAAGLAVGPAGGDFPSLDDVVPWRLAPALAPEAAARLSGLELTVDRIYSAMDRWAGPADVVIVETAGGLMVPINARFTFADLLQGLELPVIVAAANRLGVINHVLLTLDALRRRALAPIAVVLNQLEAAPDLSADTNRRLIADHGQVAVYEVPFAAKPKEPSAAAAEALRPHLEELKKTMAADWQRTMARYGGRE